MELVAYGAQDVYLTGNPQITFFKVVYRRHTNFSIEAIEQSASGNSFVGSSENEASFTIARHGDLIHKVYLSSNETTVHGIQNGSEIIKEVKISIGGQMIDRYTQEWQDIWNELTIPKCKALGFKAMTGNIGKSNYHETDDKGVGMLQIPLLFWFCRNPGLALPLIALQYHEVKIDFTFNKNTKILHNERFIPGYQDFKVDLYTDYIYLDTDERRRFAQVSHEYLIEQIQELKSNGSNIQDLNINHPVKELIWTSEGNHHGSYQNAKLVLNGNDRFEKQPEEYFQLRQPYDYHTTIPRPNLPNSAKHNLSSFTKSKILGFPNNGLGYMSMNSDFVNAIDKSPSTTDNSQQIGDSASISGLNNDFNFNEAIATNDDFRHLYYPTFSLRANSDSHHYIFEDYPLIESSEVDFARNNTYRFPGFFVNNKLLNDGNHSNMEHIFLPKNLNFLKIANDTIENGATDMNTETLDIDRDARLFTGNFTYRFNINNINQIQSQILIRIAQQEETRTISLFKQFSARFTSNITNTMFRSSFLSNDTSGGIVAYLNGDGGYPNSEVYDYNLHEFMVLILPSDLIMVENREYEFEVQSHDTQERKFIKAKVTKIINGSSVKTVSVGSPVEMNAAFGGSGYVDNNDDGFDNNNTNTNANANSLNLNQRHFVFGSGDVSENETLGPVKAKGITLAGGQDLDQVQFIYLDNVINPDLMDLNQDSYKSNGLPTGDSFIPGQTRPNDFYVDLPQFKIINITTYDEIHIEKSASNTSNFGKKINVYSFSLKPEEHQPSGTCNFSRIDTAQLITDSKIGTGHNIYAVNYNVLRIMSGMGGLAYSN